MTRELVGTRHLQNLLVKRDLFTLTALILTAFYFLVFSSLSILKHLSFHSSYLDLGLESQIVWNTSQGRFLESSFGPAGQIVSALSFHVSPISALLVPFYWIWSDPIVLLLIQTAALALGGLPVFWLSRKVTGSRLVSISLLIAYFFYPPLQYSNLSDFHPQTLATPILLFAFYFLYNRSYKGFWLMMVLALMTKENISLVTMALSIYIILVVKARRLGIILFILSLAWFITSLYFIMPFFSGGSLGAFGRYEYLGKTPVQAVWRILTNPGQTLGILLVTDKLKYIFHLLVSVGFLSLAAPAYLFLALSEFFLNLFSSYNPQWQVRFHYTAAITPFIFVSAVFGAQRIMMLLERRKIAHPSFFLSFYLLLLSIFWNITHSPSPINNRFDRSLFMVDQRSQKASEYLRKIPSSSSVSAMNNLGAQLSTRRFLFRFPMNYREVDYVVVDPKMPEESFDLSQVTPDDFEVYLRDLRSDPRFRLSVDLERLYVFEKIR